MCIHRIFIPYQPHGDMELILAIWMTTFIISARIGLAIADTLAVSWYAVWCHLGRILVLKKRKSMMLYCFMWRWCLHVTISRYCFVFVVHRFMFSPIRAKKSLYYAASLPYITHRVINNMS